MRKAGRYPELVSIFGRQPFAGPAPEIGRAATDIDRDIQNFTGGLAQLLGSKGIRVNSVAPGPIWTPLIVATMTDEDVKSFGSETPLGRPGQPVEVAPIYVLLASDEASYISGSRYAVTGGKPIL